MIEHNKAPTKAKFDHFSSIRIVTVLFMFSFFKTQEAVNYFIKSVTSTVFIDFTYRYFDMFSHIVHTLYSHTSGGY